MGHFLFWVIWPYVVVRYTGVACLILTGKPIPTLAAVQLRKDLARITRPITKPDSHNPTVKTPR